MGRGGGCRPQLAGPVCAPRARLANAIAPPLVRPPACSWGGAPLAHVVHISLGQQAANASAGNDGSLLDPSGAVWGSEDKALGLGHVHKHVCALMHLPAKYQSQVRWLSQVWRRETLSRRPASGQHHTHVASSATACVACAPHLSANQTRCGQYSPRHPPLLQPPNKGNGSDAPQDSLARRPPKPGKRSGVVVLRLKRVDLYAAGFPGFATPPKCES